MTDKPQLLLFENAEAAPMQVLEALLRRQDYVVWRRQSAEHIREDLQTRRVDVLIAGARPDGLDLLEHVRTVNAPVAVILLADYADAELMQHAKHAGAFECLPQPFRMNDVLLTVQRALCYERALAENELLKSRLQDATHFGTLVGDSECMHRMYGLINKIGPLNDTVLLRGESGTGKELVAKALHQRSLRHDKPFVTINCAALPENLLESELFGHVKGAFTGAAQTKAGLFDSADGGSLFLDEVGAIPISIQSKLLRVLQDRQVRPVGGTKSKPVDVRIIAATNEPLEKKISSGAFREDLYYRLSVIPMEVPPLRSRSSDIALLAEHILKRFEQRENRQVKIQPRTLLLLQKYAWPGNVRELENVLNRAAALCDDQTITEADVRPQLGGASAEGTPGEVEVFSQYEGVSLKAFIRAKEREFIGYVLSKCGGNKEQAAKVLGISSTTLYRKYGTEDS